MTLPAPLEVTHRQSTEDHTLRLAQLNEDQGVQPGVAGDARFMARPEGWQTMESAPKDAEILGWGVLLLPDDEDEDEADSHPRCLLRAVIYWDPIDSAWCVSSHAWSGPFFKPRAWHPLPSAPPVPGFLELLTPEQRAAILASSIDPPWPGDPDGLR